MTAQNYNFIFDMTRNNTYGIPDGNYSILDYHDNNKTNLISTVLEKWN